MHHLLASTALVASAGFAAAEISISGSAEMGIVGGDRYAETGVSSSDPRFHQDFTINVDGTGETDGGLAFGFHVEIEESNTPLNINGNASYDNEAVWVSGAFGKVTMGETDGALDWAMTEVALAGGSIADDETAHAGYNGNGLVDDLYDGQVLRYEYSMGDIAFAGSIMMKDADELDLDPVIGLGVKYATEMSGVGLSFGLGYQTTEAGGVGYDVIGVSAVAKFDNGLQAAVNYSQLNSDIAADEGDHMGLGVAYSTGAWTFAANYGKWDWEDGSEADGYGMVVNYDLGGGAVIQAGYGSGEENNNGREDSYSVGVALSF